MVWSGSSEYFVAIASKFKVNKVNQAIMGLTRKFCIFSVKFAMNGEIPIRAPLSNKIKLTDFCMQRK